MRFKDLDAQARRSATLKLSHSTGPLVLAHRLVIDPLVPEPGALVRAAEILRQGGIVAYPTETLYGLGVDPFNEAALEKLYDLKGRPGRVPVSVLVRDFDMLLEVAPEIPPAAMPLLRACLPGPLTAVLAANTSLPARLTGGSGKIGVRISSHPVAVHLFRHYPAPITTTSANPRGLPGAASATQVEIYFPGGIDLILDGGEVAGGVGSTVVDLTGERPVILREGAIPADEILRLSSGCALHH